MKLKTFNKSQCSIVVRLLVVSNLCGQLLTVEMVNWYCVSLSISVKLCISSKELVFHGTNKCNIGNKEGVYDILYRSVLSTEQTWHTVLCAG